MKAKRVFTVLLATVMTTVMLTACGGDAQTDGSDNTDPGTVTENDGNTEEPVQDVVPTEASVDFEDGAYGFVKMCLTKGGTPDESLLSVVDYNGSKALYVENVSGKSMFIGINVSALLGDKVADLSTIMVDIGTEYADGSFSASSGYLYAYVGEGNDEVKAAEWSVYLETQNPKTATFDVSGLGFVAGADNYIIISKETDNNTAAPASMYLDNITFLDAFGNVLAADTSADFGSPAGFESTGKDLSNLCILTNAVEFEGFAVSGGAWGQDGFEMPQEILDALVPGAVVEIEYSSEDGAMWIVMPDSEAGWMRVGQPGGEGTPAYVNNAGNIAQITYEQIAALCGDDVSTWGARMQCESSTDWEVYSVKVGQAAPVYSLTDAVEFEGFAVSSGAWGQDGLEMPQEIIDALVPGSVVEITYASEDGAMWIVMPDSEAGWMRVGQPGGEGTPSAATGSVAYITYEQIAALCGDDVSTWGARMQCESSTDWEVYSVRVGTATAFKMNNNQVSFEGFAVSGGAWGQDGFEMPQEILDALVPGAVVNISYSSEDGTMWIVMPDSEAGWMRVGQPGGEGTPAAFNGSVCQITYEQIAELCGDDISTWGARMQCEAQTDWEVYSVTVGQSAQ